MYELGVLTFKWRRLDSAHCTSESPNLSSNIAVSVYASEYLNKTFKKTAKIYYCYECFFFLFLFFVFFLFVSCHLHYDISFHHVSFHISCISKADSEEGDSPKVGLLGCQVSGLG